jgi:hypothetical protein
VCAKHAVVTFLFRHVTDMELNGFNHQNALMGLDIERGPEGRFRMNIDPAYGIGGVIEALTLEVTTEPGIPAGSQYLRRGSTPASA